MEIISFEEFDMRYQQIQEEYDYLIVLESFADQLVFRKEEWPSVYKVLILRNINTLIGVYPLRNNTVSVSIEEFNEKWK